MLGRVWGAHIHTPETETHQRHGTGPETTLQNGEPTSPQRSTESKTRLQILERHKKIALVFFKKVKQTK